MVNVIFLADLYDPNDMIYAREQKELKDYCFWFPNMKQQPKFNIEDTYYTILPNGEMIKITNLDIFDKNKDIILQKGLNDLSLDKENITDVISHLLEHKKICLDNKDILSFLSISMKITSIYLITNNTIASILENQDGLNDLFDKIGEMQDEDVKIINELDIVNSLLRQHFSYEELTNMEILEAKYNDEIMSKDDIIDKLSSHYLPEHMTQIDIRTTKKDKYIIKSNLCDIVREPDSFEIKILSKDGEQL